MDREKLNLELEIEDILSEFSKKKTQKEDAPRKVSDNTINMLLEDILKGSGKSPAAEMPKEQEKPISPQKEKTVNVRKASDFESKSLEENNSILPRATYVSSPKKSETEGSVRTAVWEKGKGGFSVEAPAKAEQKPEKPRRSAQKKGKDDNDPLKINENLIDSIPTWEERHSKEYLEKNPQDPINKIRSMSGAKASSEFLDGLKEKGGIAREKREVIYKRHDKFFSQKISFDTQKVNTIFNGLEKVGENEWKAPDTEQPVVFDGTYETDGEYHRFSESADIRRDLDYQKRISKIETALTFISAILMVVLSFSHLLGSPFNIFSENPKTFLILSAVITAAAILVNFRTLIGGIGALFRRKVIPGSIAAAVVVPAFVQNLLLIGRHEKLAGEVYDFLYGGVAVICLLFVVLGRNASLDLRIQNFQLVGNREEKYPLMSLVGNRESRELGRGLTVGDQKVCLAGRCDEVSDFMYQSYAEDCWIKSGKVLFFASLIFSALCGLIWFFFPGAGIKGDGITAFSVFCAALCMTQPALLSLSGNALFRKTAGKLKRYRIMLSGFDAVEDFADADIIAFDAGELFPEGSVVLKGLKASESRMLDYSIIDAAKILEMSGGPLSPLFSKIMQNDTGFDPQVDTIVYEEEMGISGWVSGQRVLVGNRKLLKFHGVRTPDYGYEERYEGTNIRPVYLANEGRLNAVFLVQYKASRKIAQLLREAVKRGMALAVYSSDPNITSEFICRLFRLPAGSVRVMGTAAKNVYKKLSDKSGTPLDGTLLCDGEAKSLFSSVIACKKLKKTLNVARGLMIAMCFIGAVLCAGLIFSVGFSGLTVGLVLAFEIISYVIIRGIPALGG